MAASVGWEILYADQVDETPPPTVQELEILRDLHARTKAAHEGKRLPITYSFRQK